MNARDSFPSLCHPLLMLFLEPPFTQPPFPRADLGPRLGSHALMPSLFPLAFALSFPYPPAEPWLPSPHSPSGEPGLSGVFHQGGTEGWRGGHAHRKERGPGTGTSRVKKKRPSSTLRSACPGPRMGELGGRACLVAFPHPWADGKKTQKSEPAAARQLERERWEGSTSRTKRGNQTKMQRNQQ